MSIFLRLKPNLIIPNPDFSRRIDLNNITSIWKMFLKDRGFCICFLQVGGNPNNLHGDIAVAYKTEEDRDSAFESIIKQWGEGNLDDN